MTEPEIKLQLITAAEKGNREEFEKFADKLEKTEANLGIIKFYKDILEKK